MRFFLWYYLAMKNRKIATLNNKTTFFKIRKNRCLLLCFCMLIPLLSGCKVSSSLEGTTKQGFYLDTVIFVTLYDASATSEIQKCFSIAERYEKMFSTTVKGSDIWNINHANGAPVSVSKETIFLLKKGISYGKISNGKFDITIGKLSSLWDFDHNDGTIPSKADITAALSSVDYQNIQIADQTVTLKNPSAMIDLGGIAKGYIADQMKAYLNKKGVHEGLINLGGNVLSVGEKTTDSKTDGYYTIGIQKPFSEDGTAACTVKIKDQSVVTSGIYQRYFKKDNTIYHHILDVKTGYPYENGLSSVTIINSSSVDGDALSTTVFAMGLSAGKAYVESLKNTEAVFITTSGKIYTTAGLKKKIPFSIVK